MEGCKDVVQRWQRALEDAHGATHELQGVIHVSAPADTTYVVLAPVVVAVSAAHPKVQVVLHSSDAVQPLHREAIDMAIRYGPLQDSGLSARKLAEWPAVLVAAPAYLEQRGRPRSPAELAAHRCVTLQISSVAVSEWTLFGDAGAESVALRSPLCADGYMARRWAIEGQGIALKSLFDVIDDLQAGRLLRVLPTWATAPMPIHLLFPSRRYLPARVRALSDAVVAHFSARSDRCAAWLAATR